MNIHHLILFPIFFLGLSVGSFLNVVIHRLPREGLSISRPARSFCPVCGKAIRFYDNIPVLSWLFLRARCRECGEKISPRYPVVELACGLLALYLFQRFGLSFHFPAFFYFSVCLLAIALIDLELMVIPTVLMYPATILAFICAALEPAIIGGNFWFLTDIGPRAASLAHALAGFFAGWGALKGISVGYKLVRGHEGMGDGDPPLLGMIGAFLGWQSIPLIILTSTLIGLASVGLLILTAKKSPAEGWGMKALPFGPFLVLAAFFYLFFGPQLIAWYFSLLLI